MANTPDKVVAIALAEVGYLEKSKSAYQKDPSVLDRKTDGAGSDNYTKYGRDMHQVYPAVMDFPAYWCDAFVDWCFYKAYGVATAKSLLGGNFDDYTVASAQMYKNKNAYIYRGKGTPQYGDQIFFRNNQRICHTGLVTRVDGNRVYTVEGNTSSAAGVVANGGCVREKSYLLTDTYIDGYGRPKYDTVTSSNPTPTSTKSIDVIVDEVISGKWSSGDARKKNLTNAGYDYATVQKKVNEKLNGTAVKVESSSSVSDDTEYSNKTVTASKSAQKKDASLAGQYTVTASDGLYVRDGAGTNHKALVKIPKGTKVRCYGFYTLVNGVKWLYIQFVYKNVKYTGFSSGTYLKK